MRSQKPYTPMGPSGSSTNMPSEQLFRSKNTIPGNGNSHFYVNSSIPERMTSSIEPKKKGELISKI